MNTSTEPGAQARNTAEGAPDPGRLRGPGLELRVLYGPQAGASAELLAGMSYSIGSSDACDLVLEGPGVMDHHLQVEAGEDNGRLTATIRELTNPDPGAVLGEPTTAAPGTRLTIGLNVVEIASTTAPWATPSEALQPEARLDTPDTGRRGQRRDAARRAWWLFPAALLAAVSSAAVILLHSPASDLDPAAAGTAAGPDAQELQAPRKAPDLGAFSRFGPVSRLRLEPSGDAWTLHGSVPDSTSMEELRAAALQEGIADVRVLHESDRRRRVEAFLHDEQAQGTVRAWVQGGPGEVLQITGAAKDDEAVSRFMQRALHALEDAKPIGFHVLPRRALGPELGRRLTDAGIQAPLEVMASGEVLKVKLALREADRTRWEKVLAGFARDYGDLLEVQAQVRYLADPWTADVEAIVGGRHPYVVTRQGTRIMPGERLGDRLITDIRGHELVFADGTRWSANP